MNAWDGVREQHGRLHVITTPVTSPSINGDYETVQAAKAMRRRNVRIARLVLAGVLAILGAAGMALVSR